MYLSLYHMTSLSWKLLEICVFDEDMIVAKVTPEVQEGVYNRTIERITIGVSFSTTVAVSGLGDNGVSCLGAILVLIARCFLCCKYADNHV